MVLELIIKKRSSKELGLKGGIGIGLTLVNHIIKWYGGVIQVKVRIPDNPSEGSNFVVQIPTR